MTALNRYQKALADVVEFTRMVGNGPAIESLRIIDQEHTRLQHESDAHRDEKWSTQQKLSFLQGHVRECITELRATGGAQNVLCWLERALEARL